MTDSELRPRVRARARGAGADAVAQIEDKTLVEGCVFNCTNIIQEQFDECIFTMDELKASLRKVIATAIKRGQSLKTIFETNKMK